MGSFEFFKDGKRYVAEEKDSNSSGEPIGALIVFIIGTAVFLLAGGWKLLAWCCKLLWKLPTKYQIAIGVAVFISFIIVLTGEKTDVTQQAQTENKVVKTTNLGTTSKSHSQEKTAIQKATEEQEVPKKLTKEETELDYEMNKKLAELRVKLEEDIKIKEAKQTATFEEKSQKQQVEFEELENRKKNRKDRKRDK